MRQIVGPKLPWPFCCCYFFKNRHFVVRAYNINNQQLQDDDEFIHGQQRAGQAPSSLRIKGNINASW